MDLSTIIALVQQSLAVILIFFGFLFYAMVKGRQSLINVIMGLYVGLLLSLVFPYYEQLGSDNQTFVSVAVFLLCTFAAVFLFARLMPREYDERVFESFGKKALFAAAGTVLVLAFSYHALPLSEMFDPGPIKAFFLSEQSFFWWLIVPLVILFFL